MKYSNGLIIRLGDKVTLGKDKGIVVCSIDTDEFTSDHPREQWSYLKVGIMVEFADLGLVHFPESDPNLHLISRASGQELR